MSGIRTIRLQGTDRVLTNPLKIEGLVVHNQENGLVDFTMDQTPDNIHLVNDYGIDCPSLMPSDYDFFRLYKNFNIVPYPDQIKGAAFLTKYRRCGLLTEMSGGKTLTALMAIDYQVKIGKYKKILIICPSSNVVDPWKQHLVKYYPHLFFKIAAHRSTQKRKEILSKPDTITIISMEAVYNSLELLSDVDFDLIVIDEFSWLKSTNSQRYKAVKKLLKPHTNLYALTASPVSNSPLDAYALISLMHNVDMFGRHVPFLDKQSYEQKGNFMTKAYWGDLTTYKIRLKNDKTNYPTFIYKPKEEAIDIINQYLHPFFYGKVDREGEKRKSITLHPPIRLRPTQLQIELIEKIRSSSIEEFQGAYVLNKARTTINKIFQVASGIFIGYKKSDDYDPELGYRIERHISHFPTPAKINKMLELINESPSKVIVLSNFIGSIDSIAKVLETFKIKSTVLQDCTGKAADNLVEEFKKIDDIKVLLTNPLRISHGKNIQQASTIIWFDPPMRPEIFTQVNGRIDRPAQQFDMNIYQLAVCSQEVSQYNSLKNKKKFENDLKKLYLSFIGSDL